jgi:hypothetical protein
VKPQLPANAVVTPWSGEGVSALSQNTWASKWVCTSTNPGATSLPVASTVRAASASTVPIWTMRPSAIPTSARRRAAPVPSITSPPLMTTSSIVRPPWCARPVCPVRVVTVRTLVEPDAAIG